MRHVHAGEGGRGESPLRGCYARESAGGETCPCGGGLGWGRFWVRAVISSPHGDGPRRGMVQSVKWRFTEMTDSCKSSLYRKALFM